MDLLEKFSAIELKAGNRISEADKDYCERHQDAYESALTSYTALLRISMQLKETQKSLLDGDRVKHGGAYMLSERDVNINEYSVRHHLENLPERFTNNIVQYFCDAYAISVASWSIYQALEKQANDGGVKDVEKNVEPQQMRPIRYETIVDLIFKEMDGRSFEEFAMYQLKAECRKAFGIGGGYYERKKAVICFRDSFCYASSRDRYGYSDVEWHLKDNAKSVLKALAHYETGKFGEYPGPLAHLVSDGTASSELLGFYDCDKVEDLKLFKNGRMDIRFASPALAAEFEEAYLRRDAEGVKT